jgi:hypothetical protein
MKQERKQVIFYGDSLLLAGVQASLESCPGIRVHVLNQPLDKSLEPIRVLCPAALIFDLMVWDKSRRAVVIC